MDWDTAFKFIAAMGGPVTIAALYRWSVAQGKKEAVADQVASTLAAIMEVKRVIYGGSSTGPYKAGTARRIK